MPKRKDGKMKAILPALILYTSSLPVPAASVMKGQQHSPSSLRSAATQSSANAYIQAVLDDNGKFSIGTVAGDPRRPADDNMKLIYGHPTPSTSDTMIRVDGVSYSIHSGASAGATTGADTASVTITQANIQVLERLSIIKSRGTLNNDTIEIYFKITNADSVAHQVSLRTQIDTMLGDNDGAPFRVPYVGEVTKDLEFDNDPATVNISSIPTQALVFNSLSAPSVVALVSLSSVGYVTPDRVVFGYWPISSNAWGYSVDPNRSFLDNNGDGTITGSSPDSDSSLIVWWGYPDARAFNLAPGGSKEFAIRYGLGDYSYQDWAPLRIGLFSPARLDGTIQAPSYVFDPAPFTVSAFFNNISASTVAAGRAALNLHPGFALEAGQAAAKAIEYSTGTGIVGPGQTAQVDWLVRATGRYLGRQNFSLTTTANGGDTTLVREIFLAGIPNAIYGQATDQSGSPIVGASVTAFNEDVPIGSATTQSDGTYAISGIAAGRYRIRISAAGRPDSVFQATVGDSTNSGTTTNPGMFAAGSSPLQTLAYPNPVRQGNAKISFYCDFATSADVKLFTTAGRLIRTISVNASGAGWHEVDWEIDNVANGVYLYTVNASGRHAQGKIAVLKWRGR